MPESFCHWPEQWLHKYSSYSNSLCKKPITWAQKSNALFISAEYLCVNPFNQLVTAYEPLALKKSDYFLFLDQKHSLL